MKSHPNMLLYFENPVGRILEHPDGYALVQYHPGVRQFDHLQAFLMHTGRLLQQRGWNKIFGDQRHMTPFSPEEANWIVHYWLDENEQRPAEVYGAVLVAPEALAAMPPEQAAAQGKVAALSYRFFDNEDAAGTWLRHAP